MYMVVTDSLRFILSGELPYRYITTTYRYITTNFNDKVTAVINDDKDILIQYNDENCDKNNTNYNNINNSSDNGIRRNIMLI